MQSRENVDTIHLERFDQMICSRCECVMNIRDTEPFTRIECSACGHPATVPAKLGHFLLLDLIGAGGMGCVYMAEDESLGRLVAIKVMQRSLGLNQESVALFTREAQAAARLNHPNIAQIYSIGQEGDQPYIVMELVTGSSLAASMEARKPLPQAMVLPIAIDIAEALRAADEASLVHGDIKPENILLDDRGRAKLVDFGLASFAGQAAADGIWGTPYYVAPEVVRGQKADARSDLYSLGATMYHALMGKPPFDGNTPADVVKARLKRPCPSLSSLSTNIHPQVQSAVGRMLQADPALRHPTYASLLSDLRKAYEALPDAEKALSGLRGSKAGMRSSTGPFSKVNVAAAGAAPGPRPKIVVKTSRVLNPAPTLYTQKLAGTAGGAKNAADDGGGVGKPHRQSRVNTAAWTFLVLLLLAGVGAGVFYVRQHQRQTVETRRERFALSTARDAVAEANEKIAAASADLGRVRDRTREFLGPATNAFAFIRETPYDVSLLPTVRGPEPSGGAPAAPALPAPPPVIARPGPPTASSAPVTNVPLPELKVDGVVRLMSIGEAVAVIVDADRRLEAMVRETQPSVSTAALVAAGAAVATLSADAESRLETINFILSNVTARVAGATELFRRAEEAAGRVRELVESTRKDREAAARTANAEEAARAVEEAARNTERLLAEKADAEKTQASALRAECLELVLAYRFHDAHKRARNAMGQAETDAGRQAFRVLTDRYQLLSELKQFIVEQLNTDPRPWIWGSGTTAEDVMGADDNTIRVRTGPMSWNDVTVAQMLKFINIYVATSNQKVKLRTQCRMALAAAVYCLEHGGQSAVAAARTYANRAVGLCPDTSREVERLLDFGSESL